MMFARLDQRPKTSTGTMKRPVGHTVPPVGLPPTIVRVHDSSNSPFRFIGWWSSRMRGGHCQSRWENSRFFVPISSTIFLAVLLSLATAVDFSCALRLGLILSNGFFTSMAFLLDLLQIRFGWRGCTDVHRSAESFVSWHFVWLHRGKYEEPGLATRVHSTKSLANVTQDRIDMYLQVMQQCTPNIPNSTNELFFLEASRLKGMF